MRTVGQRAKIRQEGEVKFLHQPMQSECPTTTRSKETMSKEQREISSLYLLATTWGLVKWCSKIRIRVKVMLPWGCLTRVLALAWSITDKEWVWIPVWLSLIMIWIILLSFHKAWTTQQELWIDLDLNTLASRHKQSKWWMEALMLAKVQTPSTMSTQLTCLRYQCILGPKTSVQIQSCPK